MTRECDCAYLDPAGAREICEQCAPTTDPPSSTVQESWSCPIRATYHGPGNVLGSRFRVHRADETYNSDPDRMTLPYDHGLTAKGNAVAAVAAYLARKSESWQGTWHVAAMRDDYVAVRETGR